MNTYKILFVFLLTAVTTVGALASTGIFISMQFCVLKQIHADNLTWALFWAYAPVSIIVSLALHAMTKFLKSVENEINVQ